MISMLRDAFAYRGFILSSVRNDIITRFSRSRLGAIWTIIHPLSQVLIYTLVLSNVLSARMPGISGQYDYALYLLAGFLPWALFSELLLRCMTVFIEFGPLMKKTVIPKICLPIIVFLGALWNNAILLVLTLVAYLIFGNGFSLQGIAMLAVLTVTTGTFALGLGLLLGIFNVFFRDLGQAVPVVLQLLFWLTPIVYSVSIIPAEYHWFIALNPLAHLVEAYHDTLLFRTMPDWTGLTVLFMAGLALLGLSLVLLRRANVDMMDAL